MKKAILATKVGMTQIFNEDGVLTPVDVYKRQVVDKADLEKYYNECVSYYKEADYTADSWKAYAGALANAKAVLADQDATEEEVKAAIDELAKAAKNLVKKTTEDSKKPDKKPEDTNKTPVTGDPVTPMTVSYTHLDVYKRQVFC